MMKKTKMLWLIAIITMIGIVAIACDNGSTTTTAHTHTAGAAATCLTPQTCTTCGEVLQPAKGHNFGDDSDWADDAQAATCTHPSQDTRDCKNALCTEKDRRTGSHPALGHNLPGAYAATCMEDGNTGIGHCSRCGEDETGEKILREPDNHDFSGELVITSAACEIAGKEVITCGNTGCNVEQVTVIKALEHDWEWTENKIAASCEHASKDTATCNNTPCTATNERTGNDPALGHDLPGAKAATCTETGITGIGHCNRCNEDLKGDTIPIVSDNHNFGEWTQKTAATCIAPERLIRVCSHNAAHTEEENHGEINPDNHAAGCNPTSPIYPTSTYIITGSGTAFTTNFSYSLCKGSGTTPDQTIDNTLTAIRTYAAGSPVAIQFGDGTDVLNIGTATVSFNNTGGTWGNITLTGKVTSANTTNAILIAAPLTISSSADISSTAGQTIVNNTAGAVLTITSGTIINSNTVDTGSAINLNNGSTLNISGGTVSRTNGGLNSPTIRYGTVNVSGDALISNQGPQNGSSAIQDANINMTGGTVNASSATAISGVYENRIVNISGGTVSTSSSNPAIVAGLSGGTSSATVTISGDALITASNYDTTGGAGVIRFQSTGGTLNIHGGTIRNTSTSTNARTIHNDSTGTVNISGGTVSAIDGQAVYNASTGTVTISGGTVSATTGTAVHNASTGTIAISGANTLVTTENVTLAAGTINNVAGGRIEISGGMISNTAANAYANAIRNAAVGTITLSNCTVRANAHADAHAIRNVSGDLSLITIGSGVNIQGNINHFHNYTLTINNPNITDIAVVGVSGLGTCTICNTPAPANVTLAEYIQAAEQKGTSVATAVPLKVSIELTGMTTGTTSGTAFTALLAALETGNKLVALDLSGSYRTSNGAFITGSTSSTAAPGLAGLKQIASIILPSTTITSIGNDEFRNCTNLTSITIPNSVTSIGDRAFSNCSGLTSITIPANVTNIGTSAFSGCTGLTSITVDSANTNFSVNDNVLFSATAIVWVPSAANLNGSVTIPNGVISIGQSAFSGRSGLTSITIPASVTSISSEAFYGCSGLTSITIPANVTSISTSAFSGCTNLTSITVDSANTNFSVNDNVLFSATAIVWVPSAANLNGSVTIPNGVTSIGASAFSGRSGLTSITIPASVTGIGNSAFSGCSGLTSVTIPNSVTSIGSSVFGNCTGLTSVTIPDSVTSIGTSAFMGCSGLTSVTIPDSVTSIGNQVFAYCSGLTSVTIPNSVTSIGNQAFLGCSSLTSVTIGNGVTSIGMLAFSGTNLTSVTFERADTAISNDNIFPNVASLREIYPSQGAGTYIRTSSTWAKQE